MATILCGKRGRRSTPWPLNADMQSLYACAYASLEEWLLISQAKDRPTHLGFLPVLVEVCDGRHASSLGLLELESLCRCEWGWLSLPCGLQRGVTSEAGIGRG